ncbi:MAG TPA: VOC family protein [Candidatus Saccharimonadales bacterium]|nr:VOC family protein [Candidatus Saccharimonadales bacterium]
MVEIKGAFSGFSVKDLDEAKTFYTKTLGLELADEKMGLQFALPGGGRVFIYAKEDHQPATFTILNLVVDDIDSTVDELTTRGVQFEHYDEANLKTDEKGIARGKAAQMGPDIAWFKDPAGNILSVLES